MAAFVLAAPRPQLDPDPDTLADRVARLVDTRDLSSIAGELLRRSIIAATSGALMSITPFQRLADDLGCSIDELRAAMHEIADTGHGEATWDTLHIQRWTVPERRRTPHRAAAHGAA